MKYSFLLRLLAVSFGLLIVNLGFAMPPAPPGPYQSVEDALMQAVINSKSSTMYRKPAAVNKADREHARDWDWGAPSIRYLRENDPALMKRANSYPRGRGRMDYPSYPNVAPR